MSTVVKSIFVWCLMMKMLTEFYFWGLYEHVYNEGIWIQFFRLSVMELQSNNFWFIL